MVGVTPPGNRSKWLQLKMRFKQGGKNVCLWMNIHSLRVSQLAHVAHDHKTLMISALSHLFDSYWWQVSVPDDFSLHYCCHCHYLLHCTAHLQWCDINAIRGHPEERSLPQTLKAFSSSRHEAKFPCRKHLVSQQVSFQTLTINAGMRHVLKTGCAWHWRQSPPLSFSQVWILNVQVPVWGHFTQVCWPKRLFIF